jgi:hypothetical protein
MATVIVVTAADKRRVGLTYKIDLPEHALSTWWKGNAGVQAQVRQIFETGRVSGATTSFTLIHDDGLVESYAVNLHMGDLNEMLMAADQDYNDDTNGRPGRPEKRVLVAATSKERRLGTPTSKQNSY